MLLPIGVLSKPETRARARALGLDVVADKVESQDICFVPDGDHVAVLERHLDPDAPALTPGPFLSTDGSVVGQHAGYARFTVGQRRGLPGGAPHPLYVVAIRPADRAVVIGTRDELLGSGIVASEVNWLVDTPPTVGATIAVQVRHHARPVAAEIMRVDDATIELALDEPVSAITPGQSLVLYDGDTVLGGAVIDAAHRVRPSLPILAA